MSSSGGIFDRTFIAQLIKGNKLVYSTVHAMWLLDHTTLPSLSAHDVGLSTFTSPTVPLINRDQGKIGGKIVCEKSSPQPCDIHSIVFLSRALSKTLTWLIRPINCPALGSCFARSSVRPIINSPPPVKRKVTVRLLEASFTFLETIPLSLFMHVSLHLSFFN